MLAAQGKPNLAVLTACLVFLFAFAIAASTHGQWPGHKPTNSQPLDSSQYLKLFRQQQQQRQEPLAAIDDQDDYNDNGRLALSPRQQAGQQQPPRDTYYATLPLIDEARREQQQLLLGDQLRREKLARQVQLARQLLADRISRQQQLAVNAADDDDQAEEEQPQGGRVSSNENSLGVAERSELLARLAADIRSTAADNDDQQRLTSNYLLSSKLPASPLVSSQEPGDSQAALDQPLFAPNEEQQALEEPKNEYFYDLQQEEKRAEPSGQPQQIVEEPEKAGKYTTLLEGDDVVGANDTSVSTSTTTTTTTTTSSPVADVATKTTTQREVNVTTSSKVVPTSEQAKSSVGSMFGRMISKISSYLPFFKQIDTLNEPKGPPSQGKDTKTTKAETKQTTKVTESSPRGGADAKLSVSDTATVQKVDNDDNNNNNNKNDNSQQVEAQAKDKQSSKVKISEESNVNSKDSQGEDNEFPSLGTFENVKVVETESNKDVVDRRGHLSNSKRVHIEGDDHIDLDISQQYLPQRGQQPNYVRSSNLVLPISSTHDELLVQQSSKLPGVSDGIVSKYIYAPTHHYYLTPNSKHLLTPAAFGGHNGDVDSSDSSPQFEGFFAADQPARMSHRSYSSQHQQHQFIPGEQIFSSYDTLKPAYAFQKNGLEGIALVNGTNNGNKSNDIYFLVMVGAFCVMAMAVVLAAGMFAYRVQQNRKSSQDTDYPTYGVVGPNNMDGKCGAAAFMGGYLGGSGPGSSGSFGSKSGSAKHLPDMYASDSGLASTDKGSSKKASLASASSATTPQDSHHHQQQQAANRTSPGNGFNLANNQDAARMYHYQHQKQQMIISDRGAAGGRHTSASDLDSEDENDEGSYTVYECPGLASAHEMEIKNPLFNDDQSP